MNYSSFSTPSRRGISSIVGALIFTVLMIAGFSAMSLALDSQTDIVNTQRVISDTELKKQQEQFVCSPDVESFGGPWAYSTLDALSKRN